MVMDRFSLPRRLNLSIPSPSFARQQAAKLRCPLPKERRNLKRLNVDMN